MSIISTRVIWRFAFNISVVFWLSWSWLVISLAAVNGLLGLGVHRFVLHGVGSLLWSTVLGLRGPIVLLHLLLLSISGGLCHRLNLIF